MGSALQLLPDAEAREDPSQQIIRTHLPGDLAQCVMGQPQFLGGQFQVLMRQFAIGALRVFLRSLDRVHMARARGELAIHLLPCP